jgi:hypothetical protein
VASGLGKAVAWDQDDAAGPADSFHHVLKIGGAAAVSLTAPPENVDVSVTRWAGQYAPETAWPRVCGSAGYQDDADAATEEGKDCNVFHGDHTGLSTDPLGRVHVVWTGSDRRATSPQVDPHTGGRHDGHGQVAVCARR